MARWTSWRKIADSRSWYSESLDWDGPACYELAIAGPRYGKLRIVYVGETSNERRRVVAYAQHGSHLSEIIHSHLRQGWCLYYRARIANTKKHAVEMENNLLREYDYDWNLRLNS